jgi:hypothetical protein
MGHTRLRRIASIAAFSLCLMCTLLWPFTYWRGFSGYVALTSQLHVGIGGSRGSLDIMWTQLPAMRSYNFFFGPAHANPNVNQFLNFVWHNGQNGFYVYGAPCWLLAILIGFWGVRIARRNKEHAPSHCPTCGYDLRATPDRCPECGTIPAKAPA